MSQRGTHGLKRERLCGGKARRFCDVGATHHHLQLTMSLDTERLVKSRQASGTSGGDATRRMPCVPPTRVPRRRPVSFLRGDLKLARP